MSSPLISFFFPVKMNLKQYQGLTRKPHGSFIPRLQIIYYFSLLSYCKFCNNYITFFLVITFKCGSMKIVVGVVVTFAGCCSLNVS